MILQHGRDGTYVLSGMTRADVENLAFGCTCAEAFHAQNVSGDPIVWTRLRAGMFQRLRAGLDRLTRSRAGRDVLTSDTYGPGDRVYAVEAARSRRRAS